VAGRFITFEGGEGAGKSTQVQRLERRLREAGLRVVSTREPGGSPRAERIRGAVLCGSARSLGPFAEALLFAAARISHVETTIAPALREGAFVICDRFMDSTRVYQGALGGLDAGLLSALERVAVQTTRPDLTIILDVPAEVGLARAEARRQAGGQSPDRYESESRSFHENLRRAFQRLAKTEPKRCVLVDADRDANAIEADIWQLVTSRFAAELAPSPQDRTDAA
jgi:dTMP kinase